MTDKIPVSPDVFNGIPLADRQYFIVEKGDSGQGSGTIPAKPANATRRGQQAQNKWHVANKEDRTYGGKVYASKKEAAKAQELDLRVKAGEIDFYLEQVPFKLPGGTKHLVDFVTFVHVFDSLDDNGEPRWTWFVEFIEVKGRDLPLGKLKRKQVEELYHITIEVV